MKVTDVEQKLEEAKKKQTQLKALLAESAEKLTTMKADYAERVRSGAGESELDELDAEIFKAERERARVEIRLNQAAIEIEQLTGELAEAHAEEEREKYQVDVADALVEAKALEELVQVLMTHTAKHTERLERMEQYCRSVGVGQIPYRQRHFEKRVQTIFNAGHSVNRAYKQEYPEILRGNVEAVERQIQRTAPSTESVIEADAVPQESATAN